ncbi:hypothetical protein ABZ918_27170 [Streptomyces viridosporus]|uniref:hypothetical protein n=1 Tax=Streptomyces viridosporus TaxID=67581 RepID=UPI003425C958
MDTQNPSAPSRARSALDGNRPPSRANRRSPVRPSSAHPSGATHENTRHTTRFTVIGNHLAQHRELSLLAIGPACHLQPLPTGAPADIKTLAARSPKGPTRIAAALRPLVAGPHNMPVITDPEEARADLVPASLAAITHAAEPVVEFTAQGLGNRPAKHLWRNLVAVDLSFYKSYISEEIRDEGRAQGRAEDVLLVLEQRGLDVSDDVRRRVTDCTDPELLRRWLTRAVTAPKAEEIFEDE